MNTLSMPSALDEWLEVRQVQTILGTHVLARTEDGWQQYDVDTMEVRNRPSSSDIEKLLKDAMSVDKNRYGDRLEVSANGYVTGTGVQLKLDWNNLSIEQYGEDRALIDKLYNIHYLRWTGNRAADNVIAVLGLCGLVLTSVLGVTLLFRHRGAS